MIYAIPGADENVFIFRTLKSSMVVTLLQFVHFRLDALLELLTERCHHKDYTSNCLKLCFMLMSLQWPLKSINWIGSSFRTRLNMIFVQKKGIEICPQERPVQGEPWPLTSRMSSSLSHIRHLTPQISTEILYVYFCMKRGQIRCMLMCTHITHHKEKLYLDFIIENCPSIHPSIFY